jgi:hypothetical protein
MKTDPSQERLDSLDPGLYAVTVSSKGEADGSRRYSGAVLQVISRETALPGKGVVQKAEGTEAKVSLSRISLVANYKETEMPTLNFEIVPSTTETLKFDAILYKGNSIVGEARALAANHGTTTSFQIALRQQLRAPQTDLVLKLDKITSGSEITTSSIGQTAISIPVSKTSDLAFVPGTAKTWTDSAVYVSGATVFEGADLINQGQSVAKNVTLQALIDDPVHGAQASTVNDLNSSDLGDFEPGERRHVVFRWEICDAL